MMRIERPCFVGGGAALSSTRARRVRSVQKRTPCAAIEPARDVSGTVKQIREATQRSLGDRLSRISVVTPPEASFQLEKTDQLATTGAAAEQASTRELARLFIEFFRGKELGILVIFPDNAAAEKAQKLWGRDNEYRLTSFKKMRKQGSRGGFGAGSSFGDEQVVIAAGGGAREMAALEKMGAESGMQVLIISLNMKVQAVGKDAKTVELFNEQFEPVYYYDVNPHPRWNGGILFKAYPEDWLLCRVGALRMTKTLLRSPTKPTEDEIAQAFRDEQENQSQGIGQRLTSLFSPLLGSKDSEKKE